MNSSIALPVAVENFLLRVDARGCEVCVGLSGGIDSVVLLELLIQVSDALDVRLSAFHVHHGLSPNADQWAAFCALLCEAKGIPLTISRVAVDRSLPGGVEARARDARYAAFNGIDAEFLALAQHADDQAETVIHHMLRGTGLKGLAGMGPTRRLRDGLLLIRPLLEISRADIVTYAGENGLKWIEDESNTDTAYTRNFIRHALLPTLAERFPHYRESIARTARHAAEADEMMAALAAIDLKWDGRVACADALDALPLTRQVNALYHWLRWQQPSAKTQATIPAKAQLEQWAQQLFRPTPADRPHQAGGHDFIIYRRKNLLRLEWK